MTQSFSQTGKVGRDYRATNPDPLIVQAGEPLVLSGRVDPWRDNPQWIWVWATDPRGKSAWVPQTLIQRQGDQVIARYDYSARELDAVAGEMVQIEREESGWYWCENQQGEQGWLPLDHVALA
jgi:uncharacterized protein YgiM (DUF1202 family)